MMFSRKISHLMKGRFNASYEKSCGAVAFTRINGEIKYVLVQQLEGFYGFPKGHDEGYL